MPDAGAFGADRIAAEIGEERIQSAFRSVEEGMAIASRYFATVRRAILIPRSERMSLSF